MQDCSPPNTLRIYIAGHCFRVRSITESQAEPNRVRSVTTDVDETALGDRAGTNRSFLGATREGLWSQPLIPSPSINGE